MNELYLINYLIFSIFLTMFLVEVGIAIISLFGYEKYKDRIKRLINPIWEVTGTFAIFYVVNFEVTYPTMLSIVGTAYAVPLLVAAIFIILRNMFIIFSEYIGTDKSEHRFRLIYSVSTLIAAILAIATLASGISGIGISPSTSTLTPSFLFNPFTILILASLVLFALSLAESILKPEGFQKIGIVSEILGFAIAYVAVAMYLPGFKIANQTILIAVSTVLLAIAVIIQAAKYKHAGAFNMILVFLLINLFGVAAYPYIFGTTNITSYIATSALATPEILITLIGGAFVAISLVALIYINYIKKNI